MMANDRLWTDAARFAGLAGEYDRAGNKSMRDWSLSQAAQRYDKAGWHAAANLCRTYIRSPLDTTLAVA